MPWDVLIRGGTVVTPTEISPLDLAIEDGVIVDIASELMGSTRLEIDATRLHVFPGMIDPHVHFNEPGRTEWEGIATGSSALAAGGGTCFFDMPLNSFPPTLDGPSFDLKRSAAERSSVTDFALWGGLTPRNLDSLEELAGRGVIGFKAFMSGSGIDDFERSDDDTLRRGMTIASRLNLPVAVHAESEELTSRLTREIRASGGTSWTDYLASRPIEAECDAIDRAIDTANETGCDLHIVHVSSSSGVSRVTQAANRGVKVTCETCPHYLLLTSDDLIQMGAIAKCAPPLRDANEVEKLWDRLRSGEILFIGSDHSPAPSAMKISDDAFAVWGGISGVQTSLLALLGRLPLQKVAALTSDHVAKRFNLPNKGQIEIGFDADFCLIDLTTPTTLTRDMLLDRHRQSPYVGRTFAGRVMRTMVRGQTVMLDEKVTSKLSAKLITPSSFSGAR